MKKDWKVASVEVLDMKETAHGINNPDVLDGEKWQCDGSKDNPCEAGHETPGWHAVYGQS